MDNAEKDGDESVAEDDIYAIVIECSTLFESLASQGPIKTQAGLAGDTTRSSTNASAGDSGPGGLSQLHQSFELWINYTGALAAVGRSLDDRLRDHQDIKLMVVDLLQMLHRNLNHIYLDPPTESLSDNAFTRDEISDEAWRAAEQAIDDLHFLASAIRKASVQNQKYNLSSQFDRDGELFFEQSVAVLIRRQFPHARRSLCEHLSASIAFRRKRLMRRNLHEEKLSKRREPLSSILRPPARGEHTREATGQPSPSQRNHDPAIRRIRREHKLEIRSDDSRSQLESVAVRRFIKAGPSLSTISTGSSIQSSEIDYPPKPTFSDNDKHCACPLCAKPLDVAKLRKNVKYWRDHVDWDVQPYVCISEECQSPFLFFTNKSRWMEHMSATHGIQWYQRIHMNTWYCDVDHDGDTLQFNSHQEFVEHMKDKKSHPNRPLPNETQLDSLSRKKQDVLVREERYICPFCDCVPTSITAVIPNSSPENVRQTLDKHIAQHLKSLAFLSVPFLDSAESAEQEISVAGAEDLEKRRLRNTNSEASYPSAYDEEMRKSPLMFADNEIWLLPLELSTIEETDENEWDNIGFTEFKSQHTSDPQENEDPILLHLRSVQEEWPSRQTTPSPPLTPLTINTEVVESQETSKSPTHVELGSAEERIERDSEPPVASWGPSRIRDGVIARSTPAAPPAGIFSTMWNRLRGQPERYERKTLYQFGRTISSDGRNIVQEADSPFGKVAVKTIPKKKLSKAEESGLFTTLEILGMCRHFPLIIQYIDWFESKDKYYIVTELAAGGELFDRVAESGRFTEKTACYAVCQLLEAVQYLHVKNIVHRDIKLENIFCREKSHPLRLVLGSFGLARSLNSPEEVLHGIAGSYGYAAPEAMTQRGHGMPADLWSVGCVAYILLCGYSPFRSETLQDLLDECQNGQIVFHERYWKDVSHDAKDFVVRLLEPNPTIRLTAQQALAHPWVTRSPLENYFNFTPAIRSRRVRELWLRSIRKVMLAIQIEKREGIADYWPDVFRMIVLAKMQDAKSHQREARMVAEYLASSDQGTSSPLVEPGSSTSQFRSSALTKGTDFAVRRAGIKAQRLPLTGSSSK